MRWGDNAKPSGNCRRLCYLKDRSGPANFAMLLERLGRKQIKKPSAGSNTIAGYARLFLFFEHGLCQPRMGADPPNGFFFRSELPEVMNSAIRPLYTHAPNAAFLHWR